MQPSNSPRVARKSRALLPLLTATFLSLPCEAVEPFGKEGSAWKPDAPVRALEPVVLSIPCLDRAAHPLWNVELPKQGETAEPFAWMADKEAQSGYALRLYPWRLEPATTTVRMLLPGGTAANGAAWAKARATHIAFQCRLAPGSAVGRPPVRLSIHLLQRGKTAGTWQAGFSVIGTEWRRIVLPMEAFSLRTFSSIAGIGFRAQGEPEETAVEIRDLQALRLPYSDALWKRRTLSLSLAGSWRFCTDEGERGMAECWYAPDFDDAAWQTLSTGKSWEDQGIEHFGWGWYRQTVLVPPAAQGQPLTLRLGEITSDDEVWFNGHRVGGFSGEYKYRNRIPRAYVIPPKWVRTDAPNVIAVRVWGGNLTFIGRKSGLTKGTFALELDPYEPLFSSAPGKPGVPCSAYDLSRAITGAPFEARLRLPAEVAAAGACTAEWTAEDLLGNPIAEGSAPVRSAAGAPEAHFTARFSGETAEAVYFSGRFRIVFTLNNAAGEPLYASTRIFEQLNFTERDTRVLPELPATVEETPYGKLRLIDVVDCSTPWQKEEHPFLQGGYDNRAAHMTPGAPMRSTADRAILGKKARTCGYGWFAYRVGRGKLRPGGQYLLRIEYPEDIPRFCPVEIQTGQNYADVGWKSGVGAGDVYDDWPLSGRYEWFDTIVALDGKTVGTGGTGSASAEPGFWVYFMNKRRPGMYYAMWEAGPAVASIRLYELDPERNAPVIREPEGLPQRTLALDWERQPDHDPEDLIRYAKLMGYSAISPVILKWSFANYADPIDGYDTMQIDARDYWAHVDYEAGKPARAPDPRRPSQHARYLEAARTLGLDYIPRIEWGGSHLLPEEARAIGADGKSAKPNRFERWCTNLLHPAAWEDLRRTLDALLLPGADNPRLKGIHWRIRSNRLPISYGEADIRRFSAETGTPLPGGRYEQWAAWASGEAKEAYDTWWHGKRADFLRTISGHLRAIRPDWRLFYHNWDPDKFGIIEPDLTAWAFVSSVVKPAPEGGRAAYERERKIRASLTAADYLHVLRTGNFGRAFNGINRADLGIRPELNREDPGIEIFAPVNYKCYAELPEYCEYFRTADGVAVSHMVSYDEIGSRIINPKYEGNMIIPGGPDFSMALELLAWFHSDARTLNFTVYTYARGFADAHRRFAQAFRALPAIPGRIIAQTNEDVRLRLYESGRGTYIGVGHKGYATASETLRIPCGEGTTASLLDLVSGQTVRVPVQDGMALLPVTLRPMSLQAYRLLTPRP